MLLLEFRPRPYLYTAARRFSEIIDSNLVGLLAQSLSGLRRQQGQGALNAASSAAISGPSFGGLASSAGTTPNSRSAREHTGPIEATIDRFK
jgi:hypothetical protein